MAEDDSTNKANWAAFLFGLCIGALVVMVATMSTVTYRAIGHTYRATPDDVVTIRTSPYGELTVQVNEGSEP